MKTSFYPIFLGLTLCATFQMTSCGKKKKSLEETTSFLSTNLSSQIEGLISFSKDADNSDSITAKVIRSAFNSSSPDGISYLFNRLDSEIDAINIAISNSKGESENPDCWNQEPASRSILTPDNLAMSLKIQCISASNSEFALFGGVKSSETSIYIRKSDFISVTNSTLTSGEVTKIEGFITQAYDSSSTKPSAALRYSLSPREKFLMMSFVNQESVCGLNLSIKDDVLHGFGSVVETGTACSSVHSFAYAATDLSQPLTFDSSAIYSSILGRKPGVSAAGKILTEYANTSGQGTISLDAQANPHINAQDLNFGPYTATELGGKEL